MSHPELLSQKFGMTHVWRGYLYLSGLGGSNGGYQACSTMIIGPGISRPSTPTSVHVTSSIAASRITCRTSILVESRPCKTRAAKAVITGVANDVPDQ